MRRAKLTGLLAKIESVYQEDAAPDPAVDGVQLEEHLWSSIEAAYLEGNERESATGYGMGRNGGTQPAGRYARVTAVVAMKGAGAAYAAGVRPEVDVLLRMAGLQATVDETAGAEAVSYAPVDDGHESATVHAYAGGELFRIVGCQARITSISCIAAQIARASFEIRGVLRADPTDAALPAIVYPRRAVLPPVVRNSPLLLGGFGPAFRSFEFNQNLELPARPRGDHPEGHAGYAITDYDPRFTAQIDNPDKAEFDARALRHAAAGFPWSLRVGTTQYNRWRIDGPAGQVVAVPNADRDGFAMLDLGVRCHNADAEKGFRITFD